MSDLLTAEDIAHKAEAYADHLRSPEGLREALLIIATNIREHLAAPSPSPSADCRCDFDAHPCSGNCRCCGAMTGEECKHPRPAAPRSSGTPGTAPGKDGAR